MWVTDGFWAAGLAITNVCQTPPFVVPIFPAAGVGGAMVLGIAWDPCTGTIWVADINGWVSNYVIGGALLRSFQVGAAVQPPLSGVAINATNGNVQVTDGFSMAEFTPGGLLVGGGPFYLTKNPYGVPLWANPAGGLRFALRPQN